MQSSNSARHDSSSRSPHPAYYCHVVLFPITAIVRSQFVEDFSNALGTILPRMEDFLDKVQQANISKIDDPDKSIKVPDVEDDEANNDDRGDPSVEECLRLVSEWKQKLQ